MIQLRHYLLPVLFPILVGMLFADGASAYKMEPDFNRLTEEFVSPHIAWAKPYARGPVKVLFILPRGGAREAIEVAQRLDIDYEYVMTLSQEVLGWTSTTGPYAPAEGVSLDDMTAELNEKLKQDYDVIVIGLIKWDMFPRECLYTIMEKVHDGTGLVCAYHKFGRNALVDRLFAKPLVEAAAHDALLTGVPWQALPVLDQLDPQQAVEMRQFHDGRMVLLDYPGRPRYVCLTPYLPDTDTTSYRELHYEYYQSLLLKSILWAAKEQPATALSALSLPEQTIDRAKLGATPLLLQVDGPTQGLHVNLTVQDEDKYVFLSKQEPLTGAQMQFALPTLPAGKYFADVLIRDGNSTADWGSLAFTVSSELNVASLALDSVSARAGETATAVVELSAAPPAGSVLVLRATDNLGREMIRKSVPAAQQARIPFQVTNPLAMSAEVEVFLLPAAPGTQTLEQTAIARASTTLYIPLKRSRGNYAHAVWSAASDRNDFIRRLHFRQLRNCDVDMQTNGPTTAPGQTWLQQNNFDTIPYATRYSYSETDPIRKPCLTDPGFLGPHLEKLQSIGAELAPYGPRAYTLGDECFLARGSTDVCFSPTCIADFREWLRGEYPTIEALNASWGTEYKSFDEPEPITFEDALKLDQRPRWVDHRRHMEFVYARMMERAEEAIRKGDPEAEVGFDGPFDTSSYSGNDWWRLMRTFDMCNVYFHQPTQWEFLRSFSRPGMLLGLWYGGYFEHRTEDEERMWPWKGILNGFNSMWWYAVYHGTQSICPMDALTPSTTVYPSFQWATEEMKELRAGSGQALMNSKRLDDGIGVHYSQSSLHASTLSGEWGRLDRVWLQTFATLEDMGLQYTCVAYEQIEQDGIDVKRYPAFILPYSQAISPREAAAFIKYVNDGGVLVADVRPGLYDHHGKASTPGLLDELFGIKRVPGTGPLKNQAGSVRDDLLGGAFAELIGLDVDGDVQVTDGHAMGTAGEVPIMITKQTGKGRTVLLNYGFGALHRVRNEPHGAAQRTALYGALGFAGIEPKYLVATGAGELLRQLEIVRFEDGPIEYVGMLKYRVNGSEPTVTAQVEARGPQLHTYDMRSGQYLGRADLWRSEFVPARAKLFARLPYEITGISLSASAQPGRAEGQQTGPVGTVNVALQTTAREPARQWVEVRVTGPDGQLRRHYGRNLQTEKGRGTTYIQFALNDEPGAWQITARDVISGKTATANLVLP